MAGCLDVAIQQAKCFRGLLTLSMTECVEHSRHIQRRTRCSFPPPEPSERVVLRRMVLDSTQNHLVL